MTEPETSPAATIEVWDRRPYLVGTPKLVGRHENVPGYWTNGMVIQRFGIAGHLTVYRSATGETRHIIQHGTS